jgi:hypothetical protein
MGNVHPIEMLSIIINRVDVRTTSPKQPTFAIFLTRKTQWKWVQSRHKLLQLLAMEAYTNKLTLLNTVQIRWLRFFDARDSSNTKLCVSKSSSATLPSSYRGTILPVEFLSFVADTDTMKYLLHRLMLTIRTYYRLYNTIVRLVFEYNVVS